MKRRNMKGFTLVELLIVLLILGILIGLAVPRYLAAVESSKQRTFCANIRNILSALETYRMNATDMKYPSTVTVVTESEEYFTQKPTNPWTGSVIGVGGDVQYTPSNSNLGFKLEILQKDRNNATVTCEGKYYWVGGNY